MESRPRSLGEQDEETLDKGAASTEAVRWRRYSRIK